MKLTYLSSIWKYPPPWWPRLITLITKVILLRKPTTTELLTKNPNSAVITNTSLSTL